ncbi:MAG: hypothetical protein LBG97_07545 [Coriobacteriales bacterium]|nr:hypothetical protein [Coriobacteriales bacterium]
MRVLRKNALSVLLIIGVMFAMFPMAAYGDSLDTSMEPGSAESATITAPETQYDAVLNGATLRLRGLVPPSTYWNLGASNYNASLVQVTNAGNLYTNYFFYSNSSARIYVDYNVSVSGGNSGMIIGCYDRVTGATVATFTVSDITTSAFKCGSMYFYNLNTSHTYAIYFRATASYVSVHGSATVKH